MKVRVCFVSHSSAKGGAERALLELIDALVALGEEAYVILPSSGPLVGELKSRQIAYRVFPYKWWMGKDLPTWRRVGRTALALGMVIPVAAVLKRWRCDAVYTNTVTVCVGALAARLLGLPHIWHFHEFGREDHGLTFDLGQRISLWLVDRLSSACVASSHAVAHKYRQYIKPRKLRVVYQSVTFWGNPTAEEAIVGTFGGTRCVIVGSLQAGKGQEDAIRAVGKLSREGIDVELYIVGKGDAKYREFLQDLAAENEAEQYVKFLGYVDNPFPILRCADVVLVCSRSEAFGRVTVEAMKLGKPVIGARSSGTAELIRDGFNGFLYSPGDYVDLADKILWLSKHPEIAKQTGESARRWATVQFNQERYGREIMRILREVGNVEGGCPEGS